MSQAGTLILVMSVAVLAPLPAYGTSRRLPVPLVVFGILSGILVGHDVLGRAGERAAHRRAPASAPRDSVW
jgi:NhaP-type Na+/H+ or K+/H+ antiporter